MKSGYKKSLNKSLILVIATLGTSFLHFIVNIILARTVSIEDFGTFIFLTNIIMLMALVAGAYSSTVAESVSSTYGSHSSWKKILPSRKVFVVVLTFSCIVATVWVLLVPAISIATHIATNILYSFTPVFGFLLLYSVYRGVLGGYFYFGTVATIIVIEAIIRASVALGGAYANFIPLLHASLPISISVGFLLALIGLHIKFKSNDGKEIFVLPSNKLFLSLLIISTASSVIFTLDMILVKILFSPEVAGQYAFISTIGKILLIVNNMVVYLFILFASYESDNLQKRRIFGLTTSLNVIIGIGYILFFGVFGKYTATLLLGENALSITGNLLPYTISIAIMGFVELFILYHILRKEFQYIFVTIATALLVIVGVYQFHSSLDNIVYVLLTVSLIVLVATLTIHTTLAFKRKNFLISREWLFFFKKCPVQSKDTILIMNRKSLNHPESGGTEIYNKMISEHLHSAGKEVILLANNEENYPNYRVENGIHVIRIGGFISSYILIPLYFIFHLRKNVSTVIDSHNAVPFYSPLYFSKSKVILVLHHIHTRVFNKHLPVGFSHFANFLESYLMPRIYKKSKVVTVSKSTNVDAQNIGFTQEQMSIIHNGITLPYTTDIEEKSSYPLITYFGRVQKYKRVNLVIDAFANILKTYPNAHLAIAGTGNHIKDLKDKVIDEGLHPNVTFLGYISEEDKATVLSQSWVCIQPSEMEGWGITIIESNAFKTPVIGFDVPGVRDAIIDTKTGLLCTDGDKNDLYEKMLYLLDNKEIREKMSEAAYIRSKEFNWEASGQTFLKLINE